MDTPSTLREAFAEFDKNHDGYISKEELAETMKKFGQDISEDEIDLMIKLADNDGNNLIDIKEFQKLMSDSSLLKEEKEIEETESLFHIFDLNNDGYITEKELRKTMKNLGEKVKRKDIRKMIKEADANKDGKISFPEFKEMLRNGNFLRH